MHAWTRNWPEIWTVYTQNLWFFSASLYLWILPLTFQWLWSPPTLSFDSLGQKDCRFSIIILSALCDSTMACLLDKSHKNRKLIPDAFSFSNSSPETACFCSHARAFRSLFFLFCSDLMVVTCRGLYSRSSLCYPGNRTAGGFVLDTLSFRWSQDMQVRMCTSQLHICTWSSGEKSFNI